MSESVETWGALIGSANPEGHDYLASFNQMTENFERELGSLSDDSFAVLYERLSDNHSVHDWRLHSAQKEHERRQKVRTVPGPV